MEKLIAFLIIKSIKYIIVNFAVFLMLLFVAYVFKSEILKLDLIKDFTVNPLEIAKEMKWAEDSYFYLVFTLGS